MEDDIESVLFTQEQLVKRVKELAFELNNYYKDEEAVAVGILRGSIPFYCDLVRQLSFPVLFDFMSVSSYGYKSKSGGRVCIEKDLKVNIKGKNVLIIEDILDSGNTLYRLREELQQKMPRDIKVCCLLDKPKRREKDFEPDFIGFEIDDHFVVGYGLDYAEKYRQLPYIGILKPSVYRNKLI